MSVDLRWQSRSALGVGLFALLASGTTLLCCTLPIVLVSLGFGAAVASLASSFEFLQVLSAYKAWTFGIAAALIVAAAFATRAAARRCPADPALRAQCQRATRISRRTLIVAGIFWTAGFAGAYLALPVRILLEG
jgi:hypothetical protein